MVVFLWLIVSVFFGQSALSNNFYSGFSANILSSVEGVVYMAATWVYYLYWRQVPKKGIIFALFRYIYWPLTPLICVIKNDSFVIPSPHIYIYIFSSILMSFLMKDRAFRVFERIIKTDLDDEKRFEEIKTRSDVIPYDILYWCSVLIVIFIF